MRKAFGIAAVVAATSLISVPSSQACGDKLVPLGGGVRFEQIHVSRHPGKIVLFLNPASKLRTANDEFHLGAALERAGHSVRAVGSRDDLERVLQTANADLVVMDWSDALQLQVGSLAGSASPPILPVLYRPTAEELLAVREQTPCVAPAAKRKGRQAVVKAVEQMLERRGNGLPPDCAAAGRRQI